MTTTTQAVTANNTPGYARRKARTLIGWLSEHEGALWIAGRQMSQEPDPAHIARCRGARLAVERRPEGHAQGNLFSPLPDALTEHLEALKASPKTAQILAEAGEPRMVDLRLVCAAQPTIYVEDAANRVRDLTANDVAGIAAITLPLHSPTTMPVAFDPHKNAWLFSSPNPNLRVAGQFNVVLGNGIPGFGFAVDIALSFLQVAGMNGRYFLRDGYHRAYGLLAAGIHYAPALVKDFAAFEEVQMPAGLLPPPTYLGPRPPLLVDYLDDTVATDTHLPVMTKMVVIQAIDLNSIA